MCVFKAKALVCIISSVVHARHALDIILDSSPAFFILIREDGTCLVQPSSTEVKKFSVIISPYLFHSTFCKAWNLLAVSLTGFSKAIASVSQRFESRSFL